jgi:hypothetical protein
MVNLYQKIDKIYFFNHLLIVMIKFTIKFFKDPDKFTNK